MIKFENESVLQRLQNYFTDLSQEKLENVIETARKEILTYCNRDEYSDVLDDVVYEYSFDKILDRCEFDVAKMCANYVLQTINNEQAIVVDDLPNVLENYPYYVKISSNKYQRFYKGEVSIVEIEQAKPIEYEAGENITIEDNVISAKDTTYTAGDNVSISSENVISATDTTYTAGDNISIDEDNVISSTYEYELPAASETALGGLKVRVEDDSLYLDV